MVEIKDLKRGVLVWWTRSEDFGGDRDCPCIVLEVNLKKSFFRVQSLDDFKTVGPLRLNDEVDKTSRREMRLTDVDEVTRYFTECQRKLLSELEEAEAELKDRKEVIYAYNYQVADFLAGL